MIHRLARRQFRDGRQNAERIRRQHNDIGRMRRAPRIAGVGNEIDRISGACVLGVALVVEIKLAGFRIADHVFQNRSEAFGGAEDFRLRLARQADHLGITAAFEIEDAVAAPAVLIVADQGAAGVSRQGGLAGARQAEEDRALAVRPDIGGTMHRDHFFFRQEIVQDGEDRFLDLARIRRAADQHALACEIEGDHRFAAAAMELRIGLEAGQIDDREFGRESRQLFRLRADQQLVREQSVPSIFRDDAYGQTMVRIGAGEQILDIKFAPLGISHHRGVQRLGVLGLHRLVVVPPDLILSLGILDDELVGGRAARVLAGDGDQWTVLGQTPFAARYRVLIQCDRRQIPVRRFEIAKAMGFKTEGLGVPAKL